MILAKEEGRGVTFVTDVDVVTNLTPRPSFIVSINLVRIATMILPLLKSYKNVHYPPFSSGDRQKLEVLFHEDLSHAQTNRRRLARGDAATCAGRNSSRLGTLQAGHRPRILHPRK